MIERGRYQEQKCCYQEERGRYEEEQFQRMMVVYTLHIKLNWSFNTLYKYLRYVANMCQK